MPEPVGGYLKMDVTVFKQLGTVWDAAYPSAQMSGNQWVVLICADGAALRWRDDGVTPTSSDGIPMANGEKFLYTGANPAALRFLGAGATCHVNVWKMR